MMEIREYGRYAEAEILDLYARVGWTNYTADPQMLRCAYENSLLVLGAYEAEKLIGIIRAVGDGASIVYVQDIIVHPDFQRRGIGTQLMRAMLKLLEQKGYAQASLAVQKDNYALRLYRKLGFETVDENEQEYILICRLGEGKTP